MSGPDIVKTSGGGFKFKFFKPSSTNGKRSMKAIYVPGDKITIQKMGKRNVPTAVGLDDGKKRIRFLGKDTLSKLQKAQNKM